ncbi:MAG: hypothetical protein EOP87_01420 [Verrucomicrobiaceae bacterium]|nr:MAG: hypothetical protein EOP87_01420 [Verrucomicrobiaceae bacterium]
MKTLRHTLSMALLAISTLLGFTGRREVIHNEASTAGTHANGIIPLAAEVTVTTRFLAVQKGTADNGFILNVAATRPWGVCLDEPTSGNKAAVAIFGCAPGTLKVRASKAIAVGAKVWSAAGGKFTDTYSAGMFFVGRAVTPAGADGDLFELAHCFPMLDASGTTL